MLNFLLLIADESNHAKITYIYNKFHDDMIRFARYRLKMCGIPNYYLDAEDIIQNVFMKIIKYIDNIDFSVTEKNLKVYIFSIVTNETTNFCKDHVFIDNLDEQIDLVSNDDFIEKIKIHEQYDKVIKVIERMDERYSVTLMYYYSLEMNVRDIADLMGISEKTVYTRLERGKKLLLELVKEIHN